ncbi:hypothetical protein ABPG72_006306 [Tetrahymena utriculariae]
MDISYKLRSCQELKFDPLDFEENEEIEWDTKILNRMFLDSIQTDQKTINFLQNEFTSHFLKQAFVGSCNNLLEFSFYFDKKILYGDDFDELGQAISSCKNLQIFTIISWKNYFTSIAIRNFGRGISECLHLKEIEFNFLKDFFEGGSQVVCTGLSNCQAKKITLIFDDTNYEQNNHFNLIQFNWIRAFKKLINQKSESRILEIINKQLGCAIFQ